MTKRTATSLSLYNFVDVIRHAKPSRMEVLSILLKNPHHHSLPHALPVHMLNGTYQVSILGFIPSTCTSEFVRSGQHLGIRPPHPFHQHVYWNLLDQVLALPTHHSALRTYLMEHIRSASWDRSPTSIPSTCALECVRSTGRGSPSPFLYV